MLSIHLLIHYLITYLFVLLPPPSLPYNPFFFFFFLRVRFLGYAWPLFKYFSYINWAKKEGHLGWKNIDFCHEKCVGTIYLLYNILSQSSWFKGYLAFCPKVFFSPQKGLEGTAETLKRKRCFTENGRFPLLKLKRQQNSNLIIHLCCQGLSTEILSVN